MNFKRSVYNTGYALLLTAFCLGGCTKDEFEALTVDIDEEVKIKTFDVPDALNVAIDESTKTIEITFPGGTDVSAIAPVFTVSEGAVVSPASGTAVDLRVPQMFTLTHGNLFSTYRVTANVLSVTAFLSHHASVNDIQDDDEKAYAEWFFNEYDEELVSFVSFDAIKNGEVDLNKFKTITWYLDGDADEAFTMPSIALDPEVLTRLTDYYKSGGNLYLLGYAGRYLIETGRLPADKYFIQVSGGQGAENPDVWGVGTAILDRDQSAHPVFSDIPLTVNGKRKTFPVIGPGWKEDHNYVIVRIPEVYGLANDNVAAYDTFNEENAAKWIGVWDGIGDYFMAGIVEFLPTGEYQGRAVFQGIGGIEWDQDAKGTVNAAGENPYQQNIEKLAANAISYLTLN